MKLRNIISTIALASILSSGAFAVSIVETAVSPFYTVAGLLEATVVAPTASTAASSAEYKIEVAHKLRKDIAKFDVTGEISQNLEARLEILKKSKNLMRTKDIKGLSGEELDEALIDLIEQVSGKVIEDNI